MSFAELFLLAVGLCFDTFAVSISGGVCIDGKLKWYQYLKIFLFFATFQAGFTLIGWLLGNSVREFIESFDHWVAFALLLYIGGKMILDSFPKKEGCECMSNKIDLLSTKKLSLLSVATSIDALAVGISLAMLNLSNWKISIGLGMIFIVTAFASFLGLFCGKKVGTRFGERSNLLGGIILVAIGVKILVEHLFL